jgi:membrane-associated phospholipid phosphatase
MLNTFLSRLSWPLVLRLSIAFAIFSLSTVLFVSLADEVLEGETAWFDEAILLQINAWSSPFLDSFFLFVTHLGDFIGILGFGFILLVILAMRRRYRDIIILVAGVGGAALINVILKSIFERTRPDLWEQLVQEVSFSFPSGHAMASSAFALAVIVIFWSTRYRYLALATSILFMLTIAFSRLYLGVHFPTDIVGGWLVSTVWITLVVLTIRGIRIKGSKIQLKNDVQNDV